MYSFIISFVVGLVAFIAYAQLPDATWGASVAAVLSAIAAFFLVPRKINSKLMLVVNASQDHIQSTQEKVRKKLNLMQNKPGTNPVAAQKTLENMQEQGIKEALEMLTPAKDLYKWSILARKQVNTIKYQLLFSIKDFKKADELEGDIMLFDPQLVTVRMAREWTKNPIKKDMSIKEIESSALAKFFKKGVSRAKGANGAFVYNVYAWMLCKAGQDKMAMDLLTKALDKCADEVLKNNLNQLRNGTASKFTNKAYGERWYALHLETPPQAKAQKQRVRRGAKNQGFQPF